MIMMFRFNDDILLGLENYNEICFHDMLPFY